MPEIENNKSSEHDRKMLEEWRDQYISQSCAAVFFFNYFYYYYYFFTDTYIFPNAAKQALFCLVFFSLRSVYQIFDV